MDYREGHHDVADAAVLVMSKFTRNVHAASPDILAILDDLHTEMIIAHPALQIPGQRDTVILAYYAIVIFYFCAAKQQYFVVPVPAGVGPTYSMHLYAIVL